MDSNLTDQCKELGKTDATHCLVVGNRVYDPLLFAPTVVQFTRKQYLFLNAYRLGVPIEEACLKAELTVDQADRFLKKSETVKWLEDRALKDHIKNEWQEPGKWWAYGNDVLEGTKQLTKAQIVVFQEFGHRICPKKNPDATGSITKIEINIDPNSVKDALIRQQAIDGEIG